MGESLDGIDGMRDDIANALDKLSGMTNHIGQGLDGIDGAILDANAVAHNGIMAVLLYKKNEHQYANINALTKLFSSVLSKMKPSFSGSKSSFSTSSADGISNFGT